MKKEQCKYCKFAALNEDYLNSTEIYPMEDDDGYCDKFKFNKRVYRESNV